MTWMNEYEIDEVERLFDPAEFPNLCRAAGALSRLRHWVNSHSDGWPFWGPPAKSAGKLMEKLDSARQLRWSLLDDLTEAEVKALLAPVEKFLTARGEDPQAILYPPPPPPPGRRTVRALVEVTIETTAEVDYDGSDLADQIRDTVFSAVRTGVVYDVVVMTVTGVV